MLKQRPTRLVSIMLAALLVASAAATPLAAADENSGPFGDVLSTAGNNADDNATFGLSTARTVISTVTASLSGLRDRVAYGAKAVVADEDAQPSASEQAREVQSFYNTNNESFEAYVNNRTDASTDSDVIELRFTLNGETETKYLVADVSDGSYTNSQIVNSTDRTVDHWVELDGLAAADAPDDLEAFHDDYVAEDEDITQAYLSKMAAKYKGFVSGSFEFLPDEDGDD